MTARNIGRTRAVFDCNTLVQAIAFPSGPGAACIRLMESPAIDLFLSKRTLAELKRVLNYEEVRSISEDMTSDRIAAFIQRLTFRAKLIRRVRHVMDYPRDRDDEPYIDLAVAAKADYLVTRDND